MVVSCEAFFWSTLLLQHFCVFECLWVFQAEAWWCADCWVHWAVVYSRQHALSSACLCVPSAVIRRTVCTCLWGGGGGGGMCCVHVYVCGVHMCVWVFMWCMWVLVYVCGYWGGGGMWVCLYLCVGVCAFLCRCICVCDACLCIAGVWVVHVSLCVHACVVYIFGGIVYVFLCVEAFVCVCVFCLSVMYECLQITCLLILQFWDLQSFAHYLTPDAVVTLDFLCMLLPPLTHILPFLATHWPFWKCLTINIHYVLLFVLVQNQVCMWHSASVT